MSSRHSCIARSRHTDGYFPLFTVALLQCYLLHSPQSKLIFWSIEARSLKFVPSVSSCHSSHMHSLSVCGLFTIGSCPAWYLQLLPVCSYMRRCGHDISLICVLDKTFFVNQRSLFRVVIQICIQGSGIKRNSYNCKKLSRQIFNVFGKSLLFLPICIYLIKYTLV